MRGKKKDADGAGAVKGTLKIVNTEGLSDDEKREFYATVSETSHPNFAQNLRVSMLRK